MIANPGRHAYAAMIAANLFLALGPWMVRLSDVGPVAAGFWRLALAVPLLVLLAARSGRGALAPGWPIAVMIALAGLFFAADLAAWHVGIERTTLANATLFGNMSSLLFPLYGFLVARMLPSRFQMLALGLAMIGAALLMGSSYDSSPVNLRGDMFALLAGVFYTVYLIVIERARRTMRPLPVLALATIAGTGPLLLFALAIGETVMPANWTPLLLLSLGSQVIGQGLLVYCMGYLSPLVVGLGFLTQPIAAAAIGWIVYGERLGPVDLAGALLVCVALILIRIPGTRPACNLPGARAL